MIRLRHVALRRGGRPVLTEVDLELVPGEVVALLGPNGGGKTTLLQALAGLRAPDSGSATLDDQPMVQLRGAALARRRAVLGQHLAADLDLRVSEVVALGRTPFGPARFDGIAREALDRVGMAPAADRRVSRLSGGEQQRVHLARALAQVGGPGPGRALFLDEPTNHLDPAWVHHLGDLLRAEAARGVAVVVVLHDASLASLFADRLVVLGGGRVLADGSPRVALRPEVSRAAFGLDASFLTAGGRDRVVLHPRWSPDERAL